MLLLKNRLYPLGDTKAYVSKIFPESVWFYWIHDLNSGIHRYSRRDFERESTASINKMLSRLRDLPQFSETVNTLNALLQGENPLPEVPLWHYYSLRVRVAIKDPSKLSYPSGRPADPFYHCERYGGVSETMDNPPQYIIHCRGYELIRSIISDMALRICAVSIEDHVIDNGDEYETRQFGAPDSLCSLSTTRFLNRDFEVEYKRIRG